MSIALVTGAGRGIGAAIARTLAREGWDVLIHCSGSLDAARALARELGAEVLQADLTDPAQVTALAQAAGGVQLLVNNAGIAWYGLVTDMTDEDWRRLFSVNVDGMFRLTRAVLPGMVRRGGGTIVNVASVWGERGASCEAAYSAAKGAVIAFTKALAKEYGPAGVRVNAVSPGVIATDMLARFDAASLAELAGETPLGRIGTPEDVAEAVAFLASDRAGFITGQVLGVNGGFGV